MEAKANRATDSKAIEFIQVTPDQLTKLINEAVIKALSNNAKEYPMSVKQVALMYDIKEGTVQSWYRQGDLEGFRIKKKLYFNSRKVEELWRKMENYQNSK